MNLLSVRRTFNLRVAVFGLDQSDVSMAILLWVMVYGSANLFFVITQIVPNGLLVIGLLFSFLPLAIVVKVLKVGKNNGHIEYLKYKFQNIKEGKNSIFGHYNMNKSGFIYNTKNSIKRVKHD